MADPSDALLTKPMIVNWALSELGMPAKFSTDDATDLGRLVAIFWPRALARCFGLYEWTFCRKTHLLTRQAETPVTGYAYGFDLPGGIFGEPFKYLRNPRSPEPVRDVRIEGRTVFADELVLYSVSKVAVDPQYWDPQFADCFAVALAAMLAVPIAQDADMEAAKEEKAFGSAREDGAGGMFGRLIAQNRAAHPMSAPAAPTTLDGGRTGWAGKFG